MVGRSEHARCARLIALMGLLLQLDRLSTGPVLGDRFEKIHPMQRYCLRTDQSAGQVVFGVMLPGELGCVFFKFVRNERKQHNL